MQQQFLIILPYHGSAPPAEVSRMSQLPSPFAKDHGGGSTKRHATPSHNDALHVEWNGLDPTRSALEKAVIESVEIVGKCLIGKPLDVLTATFNQLLAQRLVAQHTVEVRCKRVDVVRGKEQCS